MGFTWESAIHEKTKIAEDGESSLDDASAKICDIFGFEAIRQVVEIKSDVYVNLPAGYG